MLKPEIKVTLFGRKTRQNEEAPIDEPTVDYVAAAEEAAVRLGTKLVIGAVIVSVSTIAAATLGNIIIAAAEKALTK